MGTLKIQFLRDISVAKTSGTRSTYGRHKRPIYALSVVYFYVTSFSSIEKLLVSMNKNENKNKNKNKNINKNKIKINLLLSMSLNIST